MREKIAIVTDSVSNIPEELARKHNINVVPLYVGLEGKMYKDGLDITPGQIYDKLASGVKVISSVPSVGDFTKVYRDLIEKEKKTLIYSIHLSSVLSGTINSARLAAKIFPDVKIKVIDSKLAAIVEGLVVLEAAHAAERGESEEKIDSIIDFSIKVASFFISFDNFEYLVKGGRAPFLANFVGKVMVLKPILTFDSNGKLKLKKFVRNQRNSLIELYKQLKKSIRDNKKSKIGICYGNDRGPAMELEKMLKNDPEITLDEVIYSDMTVVMSAHTGPGIWGICAIPVMDG